MDAYDQQIKRLTANPKLIYEEWHGGEGLFRFATKSGFSVCPEFPLGLPCGCLTMIRKSDIRFAATPELTEAIRLDERIPYRPEDITVESLPVFAEWQRRLDKELGRKPPEMVTS